MSDPYFFGYGSLVNRATHSYAAAHPARLHGWRRVWRHTDLQPQAFLTAVPVEGSAIDGLIAAVPGADWAALDARETGYDRVAAPRVDHPVGDVDVRVYTIPKGKHRVPDDTCPILLSYLDVVVQGYLTEFGESGVEAFFATTDGWDTPIRDDRHAPLYPRAQVLEPRERAMVDAHLRAVGAVAI
ncbi:ChaC-like protein [Tranquillimonas rosea]|uniref:ChaC-like protein n=1 Tax=Tranquillimonas rosea TaxID=641238 RepID=A0A1H9RPS0_9RHOB|nr:gamma-glutamylcyclotransferase family protein [Tranquillimonas rosea]SER74677.1 ChaC-like protein [Tranquillimonas rosea]